jgi:peptide alpha-N-acetyltransferase
MSAAERKKAKAVARKKKKVAEKKEAVQEEKEAASAPNGNNKKENQKGGKPAVVEDDPFGKELLKKDPLEEAKKYSSMLASYAPKSLETWILQYDVSIRRKKPLMALQALHKARSIDPESCELFSRVVDFAGKMDSFAEATDVIRTVMKAETPQLLGGQLVAEFVKAAASNVRDNARTDLPTRLAVAKALVETKTSSVADASAVIVNGGISSTKVTVETCRDALKALKAFGNESDGAVKQWIADVQGRFPLISNLD